MSLDRLHTGGDRSEFVNNAIPLDVPAAPFLGRPPRALRPGRRLTAADLTVWLRPWPSVEKPPPTAIRSAQLCIEAVECGRPPIQWAGRGHCPRYRRPASSRRAWTSQDDRSHDSKVMRTASSPPRVFAKAAPSSLPRPDNGLEFVASQALNFTAVNPAFRSPPPRSVTSPSGRYPPSSGKNRVTSSK